MHGGGTGGVAGEASVEREGSVFQLTAAFQGAGWGVWEMLGVEREVEGAGRDFFLLDGAADDGVDSEILEGAADRVVSGDVAGDGGGEVGDLAEFDMGFEVDSGLRDFAGGGGAEFGAGDGEAFDVRRVIGEADAQREMALAADQFYGRAGGLVERDIAIQADLCGVAGLGDDEMQFGAAAEILLRELAVGGERRDGEDHVRMRGILVEAEWWRACRKTRA